MARNLGKSVLYAFRVRRRQRAGIFEIDGMRGAMFDERLAVLLRSLGYRFAVEDYASAAGNEVVASRAPRTELASCEPLNGFWMKAVALVWTPARITTSSV